MSGICKIVLIIVSSIVSVISLFNVLTEPAVHGGWSSQVSFLCIFWLGTYFLCSYIIFRSYYLLTSAYVLALSIFHLGTTIPASLGLIDGIIWEPIGYLAKWQERAGWYTALALGCVGIGFGLSLKKSGLKDSEKIDVNQVADKSLSVIFRDGVGLLLASVVFLGMAIYSFGNLLNYSRVDFFRSTSDTRGLGLFMMVLPSAIVLLMIGSKKKIEIIFASLITCSSFAVLLLSGYRSAALFPALVGVILWDKVGKKISLIFSISTIVFVILAIPVIGMLRGLGPYKNISKQAIEKSVTKTSAQDTFTELGGTAGVLAHVFRLVPDQDSYRFGMTYVKAFRDSIPNLMPKMSDSYRAQAKENAMYDPFAIGNMAVPSDWITYRVARDKYNKGEGLGFSAIGEPYLNFGIAGVIIFFALLGFLLGKLDGLNLIEYPKLLFFSCAMYWPLIRTVRNDFSNFVKPAIFILIIICFWRAVVRFLPFKKI